MDVSFSGDSPIADGSGGRYLLNKADWELFATTLAEEMKRVETARNFRRPCLPC